MNAPATADAVRRPLPSPALSAPDELVAWPLIRELVGFPTVSRESNLALLSFVERYLRSHGIASTLIYNNERTKANLWATLPAHDGNVTRDGIILSGHTDVVPVDGQPWDTDPFVASVRGDHVIGRGVTDMKSFSATGLAMVPELLRRGLKRPIHFALSYDEEIGCIGVRSLIADIHERGIAPLGCIVGEPTGMQLVLAHKGKRSWRCRVRGHEAHSSLTPLGVNAVQIACEIVAYIGEIARAYRDMGQHDEAYDVPFTTAHVGVIHGGTAVNIVPRDCWFDFEIRHLPFDDPAQFATDVQAFAQQYLADMHAVSADTFIEFDALSSLPGMDTRDGSPIAELAHELCAGAEVGKVSFGTEAALFHGIDIATVICGPGHIAQAHQPNEWVSLEQLARCEMFMRRLADRVCVA
ncbi:MAG TPA: acetylornithine deacetylase [Casimicrobiaceae bacterium]|nr:acetylornithine deacetylase [Casimicrobiaceae bacterium]